MKAQQLNFQLDAVGQRLDRALAEALPELSRMQWQRLIKDGRVLVDARPAKPSLRLETAVNIEANIPESTDSELVPLSISLDIRYEDEDIIIVNKPAGMVVHPGSGHEQDTLVNALLAHCPDLPGIGDTKRPGIVHRLDKDTSGLLAVAKHDEALRHLQAQFKNRTVGKKYLALVDGQIQPSAALIDAPVGRDPRQRKKMAVIALGSSARAREAQTHYEALTYYDEHALVECSLHTGRTHQIRVHLAYAGYPIVGDTVYGRRKASLPLSRHFLHAAVLQIRRPSDDEEITVRAELPPELQQSLDLLDSQKT